MQLYFSLPELLKPLLGWSMKPDWLIGVTP
jgi:hypothetical protein